MDPWVLDKISHWLAHLNPQWAPQKHCLFRLTCECSMTSQLPMKQWLELWFSQLYFHLNSLLAELGVGGDMLYCFPTSCFSGQPPSLLRTYPEREIASLDLSSPGPHRQVNYPNKAGSKFSWDRSSEIDCGWPVRELRIQCTSRLIFFTWMARVIRGLSIPRHMHCTLHLRVIHLISKCWPGFICYLVT